MGLREQKQAKVRQAIFDAAMALFAARGFAAVSVEEIAAAAGVSRATFFNHFGTKEGVLRHFGQRLTVRLGEALAKAQPGATPLDRLQAMLTAWAAEMESNREKVRLVYLYSLQDPDYLAGLTPARQEGLKLFADTMAEAQAAGQVRRDIPAPELAWHVLGAYQNALLVNLLSNSPLGPVMASTWRFVLGGIQGVGQRTE